MIMLIILVLFIFFIALFIYDLDGMVRVYYPKPGFNAASIPNQSGKIIIITGGTTGVGRASAEQLCKKDAKLIIITSRSQASADKAAKEIKEKYGSDGNQTEVIGKALALEDHKDIEKFAEWFRSLNEPLHVLMLNAGSYLSMKGKTPLGMEKTIGINWFGHFYLQQLLQDIIEQSAPSRIVIVASKAHTGSPPIVDPIDQYVMTNGSKGSDQYFVSKLFNIYHAKELHRRLRERGINNVYVNAIHPGLVATNFFDDLRGNLKFPFNYIDATKQFIEKEIEGGYILIAIAVLAEFFGLNPYEGSLTQLYAATSPDIEFLNISGEYIYPIARREDPSWYNLGVLSNMTSQAKNPELARKLWEYGESIIVNLPKDE